MRASSLVNISVALPRPHSRPGFSDMGRKREGGCNFALFNDGGRRGGARASLAGLGMGPSRCWGRGGGGIRKAVRGAIEGFRWLW